MVEPACTSLDQSLSNFLLLKRSLGYSYVINETHLANLRRFISSEYPDACVLDQKIVLGWSQCRDNESPASVLRRTSTIRELARYLISLGQGACSLPQRCPPKATRYNPHIFSREEIRAFFTALDNDFRATKNDPGRPCDAQAVFRIMYCCALRPGEVVNLKREEVNLKYGNLFIKAAKGRKERIVAFDEGLKEYLLDYDNIFGTRLAFIAGKQGGFRKPVEINCWFRKIWDELLFFETTKNNRARAYDFRHYHPTRRLALWMDKGINIAAKQVFLMNYMGHCGFRETDYYIRLTQDTHEKLACIIDDIDSRY